MDVEKILAEVKAKSALEPLIDSIPYAGFIGVEGELFGDELVFKLPFNPDNIGNPILPALHGGVIGGFMEVAMAMEVIYRVETPFMPKIIDFSLDYIRAGRSRHTYAKCKVVRQGRKVVNASVTAWQSTRDEPIANARAHFLIVD